MNLETQRRDVDKRIRVFKRDRQSKIKNFLYLPEEPKQLLVILPDDDWSRLPYAFLGDNSINKRVNINPPMDSSSEKYTIPQYASGSSFAIIKQQLHIFGGVRNQRRVISNDSTYFIDL